MSRCAVLFLLLFASEARAEGPWSVLFGAGPAWQHRLDYSAMDTYTLGASSRLDVGYRVAEPLAIGVHLGIDFMRYVDNTVAAPTAIHVPFELGLGTQFGFARRFVVAPWLGKQEGDSVIGSEAAFDLDARGPHRLSVFASVRRAYRSYGNNWSSFCVGLAWRYW